MSKNKSTGIVGLRFPNKPQKLSSIEDMSKVFIKFEDIIMFSNNSKHLKMNYIYFKTKDGHTYYLKTSLNRIYQRLPDYFVRSNLHEIVNLTIVN